MSCIKKKSSLIQLAFIVNFTTITKLLLKPQFELLVKIKTNFLNTPHIYKINT